jgi:Trypsin
MKNLKYGALLLLASVAATGAATGSVVAGGAITTSPVQRGFATVDFANAKPMPLPRPAAAPNLAGLARAPAAAFGAAGVSAGGHGNGIQNSVKLGVSAFIGEGGAIPEQFGTANVPFTTSRVDAYFDNTQFFYPFRAAGKLFFNIGTSSFVCSASLIKPGLIVTAAHCVANFGKQQFYSNWQFVPAYSNGTAPYGVYAGVFAAILTSYFNGTDSCAQSGVVCQDDVAVIRLGQVGGLFPGQRTGWLGYGWNGFGFIGGQTLITQLGYPVALDGGGLMERTDSQGQTNSDFSNNTVIGSLQTGGSSGGPWVVNLGIPPVLSGVSFGAAANADIVVGATSWGFIDLTVKEQGAAPFTSGNIANIVNYVCSSAPAGAC